MQKDLEAINNDHKEIVRTLVKPGKDILAELTESQAVQLHMAIGICGEAGELSDAIKRHAIYQKELDRENIIEELGDLEWFMEATRQELGITREETLLHNINKLNKRYQHKKYSNQQAQDRVDKKDKPWDGILKEDR